jgi:hypothetical protein
VDSTGLQATGKTMAWTPAGDTESDTESLVLGVLDLRRLAPLMVQNYSVSCSSSIGLANTDNLLLVNDLSHFLSLGPRGC